MAPSTDCSASIACGGVRSNSLPGLLGPAPRVSSTSVTAAPPHRSLYAHTNDYRTGLTIPSGGSEVAAGRTVWQPHGGHKRHRDGGRWTTCGIAGRVNEHRWTTCGQARGDRPVRPRPLRASRLSGAVEEKFLPANFGRPARNGRLNSHGPGARVVAVRRGPWRACCVRAPGRLTGTDATTSGCRSTVTVCVPVVLMWPSIWMRLRSSVGPPASFTAEATSAAVIEPKRRPSRPARGAERDRQLLEVCLDLTGVAEVADLAGVTRPLDLRDLLLGALRPADGCAARHQEVAAVAVATSTMSPGSGRGPVTSCVRMSFICDVSSLAGLSGRWSRRGAAPSRGRS